jgi:hypothetical protein
VETPSKKPGLVPCSCQRSLAESPKNTQPPTIRESVISSSGTASRGVRSLFPDDTTSLVTIETSEVEGATGTIKVQDGYKVNVGASKLDGGTVSVGTGSAV